MGRVTFKGIMGYAYVCCLAIGLCVLGFTMKGVKNVLSGIIFNSAHIGFDPEDVQTREFLVTIAGIWKFPVGWLAVVLLAGAILTFNVATLPVKGVMIALALHFIMDLKAMFDTYPILRDQGVPVLRRLCDEVNKTVFESAIPLPDLQYACGVTKTAIWIHLSAFAFLWKVLGLNLLLFVWFWHQILVGRKEAKEAEAEGAIKLKDEEDSKV